jgi:hypothetical protein
VSRIDEVILSRTDPNLFACRALGGLEVPPMPPASLSVLPSSIEDTLRRWVGNAPPVVAAMRYDESSDRYLVRRMHTHNETD